MSTKPIAVISLHNVDHGEADLPEGTEWVLCDANFGHWGDKYFTTQEEAEAEAVNCLRYYEYAGFKVVFHVNGQSNLTWGDDEG